MRHKPWPLLLALPVFLATASDLFATGDSLRYLLPKDTIFLTIEAGEVKFFEHRLERKQTLYSLAKFYGLSVEELYFYNPGLKDKPISVGQFIRVPIPNGAIKRYKDKNFAKWKHAPIYYTVKKGDTMFRIAKVHFRMPVDTLLARNSLPNYNLSPGQLIHIGWMEIAGVPEKLHEGGDPNSRRNAALEYLYSKEGKNRKIATHQGVAFWQKNSRDDLDLYALHRVAPINSIVSVTNPMSKRTVHAKVVGRIPDSAYGDDIIVVLSPLAAKMLNARDPRFFVRVKYLE